MRIRCRFIDAMGLVPSSRLHKVRSSARLARPARLATSAARGGAAAPVETGGSAEGDWEVCVDAKAGMRVFFKHRVTGETTWGPIR